MNKSNEIWLAIKGYEGLYEVSNYGHVRALNYNGTGEVREMVTPLNKGTGYIQCGLSKDGKQKSTSVHRLVAEAFLPNPNGYEQVDHRNNKKTDNRAVNLRWVSRKQNNGKRHARKLHRLNYNNNRHNGEVLMATNATTGEVLYFKNGCKCAEALNCSTTLIYRCLNPNDYANTAKGWKLTYIDRNSEEARNCGVEFRSRSEMGINPSKLRHIENKMDRKRMKEERQLKFQQMKVELLLDCHSRQIGADEVRDGLNKLARDFKAIVQKTLDGKFVREWKNTYTAQVALGIRDLYDAVRTGEPVAGYRWEWKIN